MNIEETSAASAPSVKAAETPENYYFVGADAMLTGPGYVHTLMRFGQVVKLTPSQAIIHAAAGARIVPEGPFSEIGFTPDELMKNPNYRDHNPANQDFIDKRMKSIEAADTFQRESLEALTRTQETK